MATKSDQSSNFADHIQKMLDLVFEVTVDASEGTIAGDLGGIGSFTSAADGTLSLDLSGLGEVEAVREIAVTPSTGTATISSSIASDGDLTISLDSNQDLTAVDVDFLIRVAIKRVL